MNFFYYYPSSTISKSFNLKKAKIANENYFKNRTKGSFSRAVKHHNRLISAHTGLNSQNAIEIAEYLMQCLEIFADYPDYSEKNFTNGIASFTVMLTEYILPLNNSIHMIQALTRGLAHIIEVVKKKKVLDNIPISRTKAKYVNRDTCDITVAWIVSTLSEKYIFDHILALVKDDSPQKSVSAINFLKIFAPYFGSIFSNEIYVCIHKSIESPKTNAQIHSFFSIIPLLNIPEELKEKSVNNYLEILNNMAYSNDEINEVVNNAFENFRFIRNPNALGSLKSLTLAISDKDIQQNDDAKDFIIVSLKRLITYNAITMEECYDFIKKHTFILPKCISILKTMPYGILYNYTKNNGFDVSICTVLISNIKQSLPNENLDFFMEGFFNNASSSQFSEFSEWLSKSDNKCQNIFEELINNFLEKTSIATPHFIRFLCQICTTIEINLNILSEIAIDSIDAYELPNFFLDNPSLVVSDLDYLIEIVPPSPALFKLVARFDMKRSKELRAEYTQFDEPDLANIIDEYREDVVTCLDTPLATFTSLYEIVYDFNPNEFEVLALIILTQATWSDNEKSELLKIIIELPLPYITAKIANATIKLFQDSYKPVLNKLQDYSGTPVRFNSKLECSDATKMVFMAGVYSGELAGSPSMKPALEWLLSGKESIPTPTDFQDIYEAINALYRPEPTSIDILRINVIGAKETYNQVRTHYLKIPKAASVNESLKLYFSDNEGTDPSGIDYISKTVIKTPPRVLVLCSEAAQDQMKVEDSISITGYLLNPEPAHYRLVSYIGKDMKVNSGTPTLIIYELELVGFYEITEKCHTTFGASDILAGILIERIEWEEIQPNIEFALSLAMQYEIYSPLDKWSQNIEFVENIIDSNIQELLTLLPKNSPLINKIIQKMPEPEILFAIVDQNISQEILQEYFKSIISTSIHGDGIIFGILDYPYSKAVQIAVDAAIKKGISDETFESFKEMYPEWRKAILISSNEIVIPKILPITKEDIDILRENNEKSFAIKLLQKDPNRELIQYSQEWLKNEEEFIELFKYCGKQPGIITKLLLEGKYNEGKSLLFQWFPGDTLDDDISLELNDLVFSLFQVTDAYQTLGEIFVKYFENFKNSSEACNMMLVYSATCARNNNPDYLKYLEFALKINTIELANLKIALQCFVYTANESTAEVVLRAIMKYPDAAMQYIQYIKSACTIIGKEGKGRVVDDLYSLTKESNTYETQNCVMLFYCVIGDDIDIEAFGPRVLFEWGLFDALFLIYALKINDNQIPKKHSEDIAKCAKMLRTQKNLVIKTGPDVMRDNNFTFRSVIDSLPNEKSLSMLKMNLDVISDSAPYVQWILVAVLAKLCSLRKEYIAPTKEIADSLARLVDTVVRFAFADPDIIDMNSTNEKLRKRIKPAVNLVFRALYIVSPSWDAVTKILQLATGILKHNDLACLVKQDNILTVLNFADYNGDVSILVHYLERAFAAIPGLWDSNAVKEFCQHISISSEKLSVFKVLVVNSGSNSEDLNVGWTVVFDNADAGIPEIDELLEIIG